MNKISKMAFAKLFAFLTMTYEWFSSDSNEKTKIWYNFLCDIKEELLNQVVGEWIAIEPKPPTIADLRNRCAVKMLNLPSDIEAWDLTEKICTGKLTRKDVPEIVMFAIDGIGGTYTINKSEKPDYTRNQFFKTYNSLVSERIKAVNISHSLTELPANKPILLEEKHRIV